ncbi:MAG: HD domain-containing protein [Patescibacteria group bacterium]
MNIVEEIKEFVRSECEKPGSKYGAEPFAYHFAPVVEYAAKLVDELGGDREVVLLAAWLHDIGSIIEGRGNHHLSGARIAKQKLQELNYPPEKITQVVKCILNHRGSQASERGNIEEQIIAEADAMSAFDNFAGLFKAALVYEGKTQGEARDSVRQKLERKWQQLHFAKSKKIIEPKHKAAMLLLKDKSA